jgi:glycosyltransferase involved in cell wall biosynthesis
VLSQRKIALLANTDWYLANFRRELARAARDQGAEVHCIAPAGKYLDWLGAQGFHVHALDLGAGSFSLRENHRSYQHLLALYRDIQPDLVHHFTPRCVVLGSLAAGKTGVRRVVNALTGLGHVFTSDSLKSRLARPVMRQLLKKSLMGAGRVVIFQNQADLDEVCAAGLVQPGQCRLIRGSGVDPEQFAPAARARPDEEVRVLFASRLLVEKGIHELVEAMQQVVRHFPHARLWIAGQPYAQNPTSLSNADVLALGELPFVRLLGHVDDIETWLGQVDIVALPSYREGTPKILLEAAACALPIVATDIAGCRGVVEDGVNGFLAAPRDSAGLVEPLLNLVRDAQMRKEMGRRGREIILNGFTSEQVTRATLDVYAAVFET